MGEIRPFNLPEQLSEAEKAQPVDLTSVETAFADLWKNGECAPFAIDVVLLR